MRSNPPWQRLFRCVLLGCCTAMSALAGCTMAPAPRPLPAGVLSRCIWVTRWDYTSPDDIRRAIADAAGAGFTTVFFQVRGEGSAHWRSDIEVRPERYQQSGGAFDPLRVAVEEARGRGLSLHAWINVMPGGRRPEASRDPRQLWNLHPDWFLADREGKRESLGGGGYVHLNPAREDVREYLADLCGELVANYRVEGVHLDYIRFPDRGPPGPARRPLIRPMDDRTLARFRRDRPGAPIRGEAYEQWLRDQVTSVVREARATIRRARPGAMLTVAVWSGPDRARDRVLQDWPLWARERLVDAVLPMNYTTDQATFKERLKADLDAAAGVPVVVAVGAYQHPGPESVVVQLGAARTAGADGVGVFAYDTLFGDAPPAAAMAAGLRTWNLRGLR